MDTKEKCSRILYTSPMNVLDITSGAALSMRTFLAGLVSKGFNAVALQATMFDSTHGGEHVIEAGTGEQVKDKKILRANVLGVEHLIVRTSSSKRNLMTAEEELRYMTLFRSEIKSRRPDMIILWGGLLLEMAIMREAREAGIPVIFYLVNSGYKDPSTFRYVSLVVTDTQATADLYKQRFNMQCHPIGKFIDPSLIKAPERKPEFITFINPSFEKGVNVFMPMAKLAAQEYPEIQFLVVESRGRWGNALKVLKFNKTDFPNVKIIGHQKDMRAVYANTKVLLLPSTWHESGARVIAEALLNGIPVIASNTGGSSELVGQGGVILDLPEKVREMKGEPADMVTARSWLNEVKKVWFDEVHYRQLCDRAEDEAKQHDIAHNIQRFLKIVEPVLTQANTSNANIIKNALANKQKNLAQRNSKRKHRKKN
jgi:glycosyltransferase involved in cell wall biosynthesis